MIPGFVTEFAKTVDAKLDCACSRHEHYPRGIAAIWGLICFGLCITLLMSTHWLVDDGTASYGLFEAEYDNGTILWIFDDPFDQHPDADIIRSSNSWAFMFVFTAMAASFGAVFNQMTFFSGFSLCEGMWWAGLTTCGVSLFMCSILFENMTSAYDWPYKYFGWTFTLLNITAGVSLMAGMYYHPAHKEIHDFYLTGVVPNKEDQDPAADEDAENERRKDRGDRRRDRGKFNDSDDEDLESGYKHNQRRDRDRDRGRGGRRDEGVEEVAQVVETVSDQSD